MPNWPQNILDMTTMTSTRILFSALIAAVAQPVFAQIIWTEPAFPTQDDVVTLYYDVSQGNAALLNEEPPCPPCPFVFAHTGVITSESDSPSDWQFVHNPWPSGNNLSQANAGNVLVPVSGTVHSFDFEGMTLAEYYGVPDGVVIEELAFVFRNATGTVVGKTGDESDIFYSVSDGSFDVVFTNPIGTSSLGAIGDTVTVVAQASQPANLVLTVNDQEVGNVSGTTLSYDLILNTSGDYNLQVSAEAEGSTASNSAVVFVMPPCGDASHRLGGRHQPHRRQHGHFAVDRALQGLCVCRGRLQRLESDQLEHDARHRERRDILVGACGFDAGSIVQVPIPHPS